MLNGLLVLIFVTSGSAKLAGLEFELAAFERWGYPIWFMYLTGFIEFFAGLGLLMKIPRRIVSLGLAGLMLGAAVTHIVHAEWSMLLLACTILLMTLINLSVQSGQLNPLSLLSR